MGNISSSKLSDFNPVFIPSRNDNVAQEAATPSTGRPRKNREELSPEAVVLQKIENSKLITSRFKKLSEREAFARQLATEEELKKNFLNLDFVLSYLEREYYRKQIDNNSLLRARTFQRDPIPGILVTSPNRESEASESTGDADQEEEEESEPTVVMKATNLYRVVRRSIGRSIGSEASSSQDVLSNTVGPYVIEPSQNFNSGGGNVLSSDSKLNTSIEKEEIPDPMEEITFKIKLILVDTLKSDAQKNVRQFISPILAKMDKLPNHGIFHSSISIGPWILEFTDCGLCIPRKITSKMALLSIDISEVKGWTNIQEAVNRIAKVVSRWNSQVSYSRSSTRRDSVIFSSPSSQLAIEGQRRYSDVMYGTPTTPETLMNSLSPPAGGSATLTAVAQTFGSSSNNSHDDRSNKSREGERTSNSQSFHSQKNNEQKTLGNCQDFVDEILDSLEVTPIFSESMHQFLLNLRNKGNSNLTIKLDEKFLEKFGLQNNTFNNIKEMIIPKKKAENTPTGSLHETYAADNETKPRRRSKSDGIPREVENNPMAYIEVQNCCVTFHTHEQLDLFVNLLLMKDPIFPRSNPQTYELLKAFDRAFWIKYKSALMSKPNNINQTPQQDTHLEIMASAPLNMQSKTVEIASMMIWSGYNGERKKISNNHTLGCPFGDPFSSMSFIHIE